MERLRRGPETGRGGGVSRLRRCDHDNQGGVRKGGGDVMCPQRNRLWRVDGDALSALTEEALPRNMPEWKPLGAVTLVLG